MIKLIESYDLNDDTDPEVYEFTFDSLDVAINYAKCLRVGREEWFNDTDDDGVWRLAWNDPKGFTVRLRVFA